MGGNSFVYILHKEYAWYPATMTSTDGKKATVKVPQYADEQSIISDGGRGAKKHEEQVIDLKHYNAGVLPLQNVDSNGDLIEFPDMVELPYLHEVRRPKNRDCLSFFYRSCCRGMCLELVPLWSQSSFSRLSKIVSFSNGYHGPALSMIAVKQLVSSACYLSLTRCFGSLILVGWNFVQSQEAPSRWKAIHTYR
jgi:hypothetical protein